MSSASIAFEFVHDVPVTSIEVLTNSAPAIDRYALILRPVRNQGLLLPQTLDDTIAPDHPVRAVWEIVESLELRGLESEVESNAVTGGRPAISPQVLVALWVYAVSQGEAQASEIARLVVQHDVYKWIVGGIQVRERAVADFRMRNGKTFDELVTQILAVLMKENLVDVSRLAQDGTRSRANAGTGSFRREATLEELLLEAKKHYEAVLADAQNLERTKIARKAKERGARERVERIERALAEVKKLNEQASNEDKDDKKKAKRASTTDPDARVMKMGDGGFRPAYNVQFATAVDGSGVVLGVSVSTRGSDQYEMGPMREQVEKRTGVKVVEQFVDSGYANKTDITEAESSGTEVLAPLPKKKADPEGRNAKEYSDGVKKWRARMDTDEGKERYKLRAEHAELTNARAKTDHAMGSVILRGTGKALITATLVALAINIGRLNSLRASKTDAEVVLPAATRVTV